ncbi:class I SAM-dependent methyltransferase [Sphingomonas sp. BN140010]|uniref:Class I SAM-dependent methyltransferase n=1 Tax=Sphingomonas arvum TaxID=2992113 RepID=A0ABT3JIQ0_9SPHN|nr:class I SAM-dependent methyltransferase [Sphingomonas sp. BN140010]MCW3798829.1 class I SAM-dependent methyltransferase [Sphingomonas sp. BN140010]
MKLRAPAAGRNRGPIAAVLREWLPASGLVLELASGTGEHAVHFARNFPQLTWQPSDWDSKAVASIAAWGADGRRPNLREPVLLDVVDVPWPVEHADALLSINLVHISPWEVSLALLDGAARVLPPEAPLILYGPWRVTDEPVAESNLAFEAQLKARDERFGLREVGAFAAEAENRGLRLAEQRVMPANNRMLLFRRAG